MATEWGAGAAVQAVKQDPDMATALQTAGRTSTEELRLTVAQVSVLAFAYFCHTLPTFVNTTVIFGSREILLVRAPDS